MESAHWNAIIIIISYIVNNIILITVYGQFQLIFSYDPSPTTRNQIIVHRHRCSRYNLIYWYRIVILFLLLWIQVLYYYTYTYIYADIICISCMNTTHTHARALALKNNWIYMKSFMFKCGFAEETIPITRTRQLITAARFKFTVREYWSVYCYCCRQKKIKLNK